MSKIMSEEELIKQISEKTSETVEELKVQFDQIIAEVLAEKDTKYQGADDAKLRVLARNKFTARKTKELSSNAIPWEGMVIGIGDLVDTVAKLRRITDSAFKTDPMKTVKGCVFEGRAVLADGNGKPLFPDSEANKKMRRVGKPLPVHSWLRTIYGIASPSDPKTHQRGEARPFYMSLNDAAAISLKVPLMTPVKFKGINKTGDDENKAGEYKVNFSALTKFEPATIAGLPALEDILRGVAKHFVTLGELESFHNANEENFNRWVITEGNVNSLNLEPNAKTGNLMMSVTDESLLFSGDRSSVICWVPTDRNIVIDFGVESRIFIIGRTSRGKARDQLTGEILDTPGDVMLNTYGIFAPEMFKVAPQVVALTEETLKS